MALAMALYPAALHNGERFSNAPPPLTFSQEEIPPYQRPVVASEEVITEATDDEDNDTPDDVTDPVDE